MIESLFVPTRVGPSALASVTAGKTDDPTALRMGTVVAVTARGIDVAISTGIVTASHLDSYAPAVGDTVAVVVAQDSWLCLGRTVGTGTPTDNLSPGSGIGPSILDGAVSNGGGGTLASSASSTFVTCPKYSLTFFHPVNHHVLIMAGMNWYGTVTNDWIIAQLIETTTNTQVGQFVDIQSSNSFGRADWIFGCALNSFGGALRTYVLKFARLSGTGTVRLDDSTTNRPFMFALDLGDTSVFRVV